MAGPNPVRPYCLRCYEPLAAAGDVLPASTQHDGRPRAPDGSRQCSNCGHVDVPSDHSVFWTREPRLVEWERWAKAIAIVVAGLVGVALFRSRGGIGMGQGWAIGAPIITGLVMWESASMITRRSPYFRAGFVWSAIFAIVALPLLSMSLAPEFGPKARTSLAIAGGGMLCLAIVMPRVSQRLSAWRDRRVLTCAGRYARE